MAEPMLLLSLTVPPKLEESIIDWLLGAESRCGFTSFPVNGHSGQPDHLSLAEQVSGRKQNVRFEICLPALDIERLIASLRREFAGTGIVYWVTPVARYGRVERREAGDDPAGGAGVPDGGIA